VWDGKQVAAGCRKNGVEQSNSKKATELASAVAPPWQRVAFGAPARIGKEQVVPGVQRPFNVAGGRTQLVPVFTHSIACCLPSADTAAWMHRPSRAHAGCPQTSGLTPELGKTTAANVWLRWPSGRSTSSRVTSGQGSRPAPAPELEPGAGGAPVTRVFVRYPRHLLPEFSLGRGRPAPDESAAIEGVKPCPCPEIEATRSVPLAFGRIASRNQPLPSSCVVYGRENLRKGTDATRDERLEGGGEAYRSGRPGSPAPCRRWPTASCPNRQPWSSDEREGRRRGQAAQAAGTRLERHGRAQRSGEAGALRALLGARVSGWGGEADETRGGARPAIYKLSHPRGRAARPGHAGTLPTRAPPLAVALHLPLFFISFYRGRRKELACRAHPAHIFSVESCVARRGGAAARDRSDPVVLRDHVSVGKQPQGRPAGVQVQVRKGSRNTRAAAAGSRPAAAFAAAPRRAIRLSRVGDGRAGNQGAVKPMTVGNGNERSACPGHGTPRRVGGDPEPGVSGCPCGRYIRGSDPRPVGGTRRSNGATVARGGSISWIVPVKPRIREGADSAPVKKKRHEHDATVSYRE
jgi:hypothetical protein